MSFPLIFRSKKISYRFFEHLRSAKLSAMPNAILSVDQLKKRYGKMGAFTAVDSISFALKPGEILGLLGTLSAAAGSFRYFGLEFPPITQRSYAGSH